MNGDQSATIIITKFADLRNEEQFSDVCRYINDGREIMKFMQDFWKQLAEIEEHYSKSLIKLLNSDDANFNVSLIYKILPNILTNYESSSNIKEIGSVAKAWNEMKLVLERLGKQHGTVSKYISDQVQKSVFNFLNDNEAIKKQLSIQGKNIFTELKKAQQNSIKEREKCIKAIKDYEKFEEKASKSTDTKPEAILAIATQRGKLQQEIESCDRAYYTAADAAKQAHHQYKENIPLVMKTFQSMSESRVDVIKKTI